MSSCRYLSRKGILKSENVVATSKAINIFFYSNFKILCISLREPAAFTLSLTFPFLERQREDDLKSSRRIVFVCNHCKLKTTVQLDPGSNSAQFRFPHSSQTFSLRFAFHSLTARYFELPLFRVQLVFTKNNDFSCMALILYLPVVIIQVISFNYCYCVRGFITLYKG